MKKAAKCLIASDVYLFLEKQGACLVLLECSAFMYFFLRVSSCVVQTMYYFLVKVFFALTLFSCLINHCREILFHKLSESCLQAAKEYAIACCTCL